MLLYDCILKNFESVWGIEKNTKIKFSFIVQIHHSIMEKMTNPTDLLYRGFPNEFSIFLNYTHAPRFDDKPDYSYLRKLLRDFFTRSVRVASMTMCSTGVSSVVPRMRWRVPVLRQRAVDVKLSRRMKASHEPATDGKNLIRFTTIFRHQRSSC